MSRHEGTGEPTGETRAWWLHNLAADGSSAAALRLGLDVVDQLVELVPTSDGGLLMIGEVDVQDEHGPATGVRRILPDGSLDEMYGRECAPPSVRARHQGGAATPDGGVLVSAWGALGSLAIAYDATGCIAGRPVRLRDLAVGPPLRPWLSLEVAPSRALR